MAALVNDHPVIVEYGMKGNYTPMKITGTGYGDCSPEEHPDIWIEEVLTEDGYDIHPYLIPEQQAEIIRACIEYELLGRCAA